MKHSFKITLMLILLFLITQLFGLVTVNKHIQVEEVNGTTVIVHPETIVGEPPEVQEKDWTFLFIMLGVLIGTGLIFLFIKLKVNKIWKYWFLLSVFLTTAVSLGVYFNYYIAVSLAAVLAAWKIHRPNVYVHNITEVFIYTGIVLIFLPILNLFSVTILLILISIYDAIAVWKSKHMVKLAQFQTKSKLFAGLLIPYKKTKGGALPEIKVADKKASKVKGKKKSKKIKATDDDSKSAILGGGDIAFPLLFCAVALEFFIIEKALPKTTSLLLAGVIALCTTIALTWLLFKAKPGRFYPAMPFISAGCFVGFGIAWLLMILL